MSLLVLRREGLLAGWAPSARAAAPSSGPCLCLRGGKAQSPGPSQESTPVQLPPALVLAGIPLLFCSQDDAPLSKGRPVLSPLGTVGEKMGPCPVLPTCRTAYVTGQWRGRKQVQLGPVMRPSLSPGDQLRSLASPLGQTLPSAPWKLHPVSPLHFQCYSSIPTFEMRQVQRGDVACPSQLASKG